MKSALTFAIGLCMGGALGYGLFAAKSESNTTSVSSSNNCFPDNCYLSRSRNTLLCKKYDSNGAIGALVELHSDYQEHGVVCYFTGGNRELCNLNEIDSLERKVFGNNAPPDARFVQEVAGLGVNF